MYVHKELNGGYTFPDKENSKQLTSKEIINKRNFNSQLIGFDVPIDIELNNSIITQVYHFEKDRELDKVWQVYTLLGNGTHLGDVPLRVAYEIPTKDFPVLKIAAMGLLYFKLALQERMAYYETLNYELLEKTDGL